MTWITMTTSIWLMKGFVRKSMKLQNIIETGIFTVHCLRRLLWIDNRFLKTRFQFKTSDETAKMYDYVICIRDVSEVVQNGAKTVRRYNCCRAL